jgi:hypothetical protein
VGGKNLISNFDIYLREKLKVEKLCGPVHEPFHALELVLVGFGRI